MAYHCVMCALLISVRWFGFDRRLFLLAICVLNRSNIRKLNLLIDSFTFHLISIFFSFIKNFIERCSIRISLNPTRSTKYQIRMWKKVTTYRSKCLTISSYAALQFSHMPDLVMKWLHISKWVYDFFLRRNFYFFSLSVECNLW